MMAYYDNPQGPPNIATAGQFDFAKALNPFGQKNGQQQNNYATMLQQMLMGQRPNQLAPGGQLSPFDSYINPSGDLMSAGQITPG